MRSDIAEFENTLYASVQSAEVNNPDDEDIDPQGFLTLQAHAVKNKRIPFNIIISVL